MASMVSSDALSISAKTRTTYDFTKFYENGRFADATVVCKGREWKVHKLVLASKSEYFLKAFDGPFKESDSAVIDLSEDDEDCVNALIYFCYYGEYTINSLFTSVPVRSYAGHLELYSLADKYLMPGLCTLAEQYFRAMMENTTRTIEFAETVKDLYLPTRSESDVTLRKFRDVAVKICVSDAYDLFYRHDECIKFKEVAWSTHAFLIDVVQRLSYER